MVKQRYLNLIKLIFRLKNSTLLYNIEHKNVSEQMKDIESELNKIWKVDDSLNILFLKDCVNINSADYSGEKIALKLSYYFYDRGVLSIKIFKNCPAEQIVNLFYILNKVSEGTFLISNEELLERIVWLEALDVTSMDFSDLSFGKQSILQSKASFDLLVENLINKGLSKKKAEDLKWYLSRVKTLIKGNSVNIRHSFNMIKQVLQIKDSEILKSYAKTLSDTYSENDIDYKNKDSQLFFAMVSDLLEDFSPELREGILESSIEHFSSYQHDDNLDLLLSELPQNFVKRVFLEKLVDNDKISPSLMKLMSAIQRSQNIDSNLENIDVDDSYKIDALLRKENDKQYVDEAYNEMLMGVSQHKIEVNKDHAYIVEQVLANLDETGINRRVIRAFISIYNISKTEQEKSELLIALKRILNDTLDLGDYNSLFQIYKFLFVGKKELSVTDKELKSFFEGNDYISRISSDFCAGDMQLKYIVKLINCDLEKHLEWLIDAFVTNTSDYKLTYHLLSSDPELTSKYVLKVLVVNEDKNKERVFELNKICKKYLDIKQYRLLLNSEDMNVRKFALEALLVRLDDMALDVLKKMLASNDKTQYKVAFDLITELQLVNLVNDVIKIIPKFYFSNKKMKRVGLALVTLDELKNSTEAQSFIASFRKLKFAFPSSNLQKLKSLLEE